MQISDRNPQACPGGSEGDADIRAFRARGKAQGLTEIAKAGVLAELTKDRKAHC